jgi:hypothetical protein
MESKKENILREVYCLPDEHSIITFQNILREYVKTPIEFYTMLINMSFFDSIWMNDNMEKPVVIYANHKLVADGLSQIAKRFIKLLRYKGLTVCDFEYSANVVYNIERLRLIVEKVKSPNKILFIYHGTWNSNLYSTLDYLKRNGIRNSGYLTWETTLLPELYKETYRLFDGIFVPSEFNKVVFEKSVSLDCKIIPHIFSKYHQITSLLSYKYFCGRQEITILILNNSNDRRKNFLETCIWTIEWILLMVKTSQKKVYKLIIKGFKGLVVEEVKRFVKSKDYDFVVDKINILIIDDICNEEEIKDLHKRSHIYVSLAHGEGVGMNVVDACLHGSMVVVPKFGGYVDYLGDDYPYYIEPTIKVVGSPDSYGCIPPLQREIFHSPQKWAFVEKEIFFEKMKEAVEIYNHETEQYYTNLVGDTMRKVNYYTSHERVGHRYLCQIKKMALSKNL